MWHHRISFMLTLLIALVMASPKASATNAKWQALLKKGYHLIHQTHWKKRKTGAKVLLQAYRMHPKAFRSLEAAGRAAMILAAYSKDKKELAGWGKFGWKLAKKMIRRWPKRAEGYYWASVGCGNYASGGGIWAAISKGLASKVRKRAQTAIKLNPRLYKGASQRVLGRYYYKIPWPMRKLKRSRKYLEYAYRLAPNNSGGIRFLAETLWSLGYKKRARRLFKKCAAKWSPLLYKKNSPLVCRKWLSKHK